MGLRFTGEDYQQKTTHLRDSDLVEEGLDDPDEVSKAEVAVGDHALHLPQAGG